MRVVGTRIPTTGEDRKIYSTVDSTATAGQTVFAVNYDEGKVACWLNGIRLVQGQDFSYTASGVGSQITLSSGIVANDYVEVVGFQGIYSGNALVEDRFVVGTSSTGSGGSYTNSTTVFPVANNTGDLVCVYRNGIKLVHTTDFVVSASGNTVTLQSASNTADEITVHVIGILQHSNFVPVTGGTFTGTVAYTGTLNVSGGTLTTTTAQKDAIVDGSTAIARSGNNLTFAGNATVTGDLTVDTDTLKVDSANDRVGIGRTDPQTTLDIAHSGSSNSGAVRIGDPSTISNNTSIYMRTTGDAVIGTGGGDIVFDTNIGSAERMRIDHSSGNVGIRTASPTSVLTVKSDATNDMANGIRLEANGSTNTPVLMYENNTAEGCFELYDDATRNVRLMANGSSYFDGGNVGVGTTTPTLGILQVEKTSSAGSANIAINAPGSGTHSEVYHITANRRFNVGVHGNTGKYFIYDNNAGATRLEIDNNGNITTGTTNNERIIIGSAGGGIDFSASSSSYGISGEILKHAESGTWTPTTKIGNTTQSLTGYSVGYDKIGNLVFAHGYVRFTANGTGTITLALPFNPVSAIAISGGYWFDLGTGANNLSGVVYPNSSDQTLLFMRPGSWDRNTTTSYLQHSDFDGNRYIYFSATYRT